MPVLQKINTKLFSFTLGIIFTLGFAPFHLFPLAFIALYAFFRLSYQYAKESAILGWFFGFGHFLSLLYWIPNALFVEFQEFGYLILPAILLIPATLAIYIAIYNYAVFKMRAEVALSSTLWVAIEYIRSEFFLPFPWGISGYVLNFSDSLMQINSVVGLYGASLFFVLTVKLVSSHKKQYVAIILYIALFTYGQATLHYTENSIYSNAKNKDDISMRLIQPNLHPHHLGNLVKKQRAFKKIDAFTKDHGYGQINYVIFPESIYPDLVSFFEGHFLKSNHQSLSSLIPSGGGKLIIGADRFERFEKKLYNSIFFINDTKSNYYDYSIYDKIKLVPFGEYIPLKKYMPFIDKIVYGAVDFSRGNNNNRVIKEGYNFLPLVCYEVAFWSTFSRQIIENTDIILNLTNDAWFGNSSQMYQHLEIARTKAVEYKRPVLRVTNSGITAIIDQHGRIINSIDHDIASYIDVYFAKDHINTNSVYASYLNDYLEKILLGLFFLFLLLENIKRKLKR